MATGASFIRLLIVFVSQCDPLVQGILYSIVDPNNVSFPYSLSQLFRQHELAGLQAASTVLEAGSAVCDHRLEPARQEHRHH